MADGLCGNNRSLNASPEAASLRVRSIPGQQYCQHLPAGKISIRSVLRQRASPSVAINRNTHRIPVPPVGHRPRLTVLSVSSYPHSLDNSRRYADDGLVHRRSELEAETLKVELQARLAECGLEMHPTKTKIVYCKDGKRQGRYPNVAV